MQLLKNIYIYESFPRQKKKKKRKIIYRFVIDAILLILISDLYTKRFSRGKLIIYTKDAWRMRHEIRYDAIAYLQLPRSPV